MTVVILCRTFQCKTCKLPMKLPLSVLLQQAVDPANTQDVSREVVLICRWCKKIELYSLVPDSFGHIEQDKQIPLDECDSVNRLLPLGLMCNEWETCSSRPPLLLTLRTSAPQNAFDNNVPATDPVYDAVTREITQGWTGLRCGNGHPIRFR